jgi:predicted RNase H-like nuclease
MTNLLVGFESAWTLTKSGAIVGVLQLDDGTFRELGSAQSANYLQAESVILQWQVDHVPAATIVLLDQPTIVNNAVGQRPVENLAGSAVSLRYGGMQPANTGRAQMFGKLAPMWSFLTRFGGPADPFEMVADTRVFETYPVLAMMALGWMLPDSRAKGRLPKYNPARKKTFSNADWKHVCRLAADAFRERGLMRIVRWIESEAQNASPNKSAQDGLDACLCLLVALDLAQQKSA